MITALTAATHALPNLARFLMKPDHSPLSKTLMRGAATDTPVVHQKRRGQAQQRPHRKERDLAALPHRTALQQHPELSLRFTCRQIQVISKGGHAQVRDG
jgi:hypothetical protein